MHLCRMHPAPAVLVQITDPCARGTARVFSKQHPPQVIPVAGLAAAHVRTRSQLPWPDMDLAAAGFGAVSQPKTAGALNVWPGSMGRQRRMAGSTASGQLTLHPARLNRWAIVGWHAAKRPTLHAAHCPGVPTAPAVPTRCPCLSLSARCPPPAHRPLLPGCRHVRSMHRALM